MISLLVLSGVYISLSVYDEYMNTTKKVSEYYKQNYSQIFHDIDGNDQIDKITSKIKKIIKNT